MLYLIEFLYLFLVLCLSFDWLAYVMDFYVLRGNESFTAVSAFIFVKDFSFLFFKEVRFFIIYISSFPKLSL